MKNLIIITLATALLSSCYYVMPNDIKSCYGSCGCPLPWAGKGARVVDVIDPGPEFNQPYGPPIPEEQVREVERRRQRGFLGWPWFGN